MDDEPKKMIIGDRLGFVNGVEVKDFGMMWRSQFSREGMLDQRT